MEIVNSKPSEPSGIKEVVAKINGKGVFKHLKYESGVHRVQRVPETESQGRIHTSTVTIAILPEVDEVQDIEIDKNPRILEQYDKVIMLHNEYVTRVMFDAITNHPNVFYLYPNALYAEIEVNYMDETITLIRGHNYPEPGITNGFDWELDNTHPYEFDSVCLDMEIYKIENGWMTNCYPENLFLQNTEQLFKLLKFIKDL